MRKGMKRHSKKDKDIVLILNSYEDIFSSFDPRDYLDRAMSGDFLVECRKASEDKQGKFGLRLLIPRSKRNANGEVKIKKRIKEHFMKHFIEKKKEIRKIMLLAIFWILLGSVMLVLTALFLNNLKFWVQMIMVIAHPAGWFFLWEGMGKLLITIPAEKKPSYNFYKKMANSEISFVSS